MRPAAPETDDGDLGIVVRDLRCTSICSVFCVRCVVSALLTHCLDGELLGILHHTFPPLVGAKAAAGGSWSLQDAAMQR